ncbi:hypothetical protein RHGRI_001823 [Rhododendron griersonianum]|uniref:Uncharacterized protein n=1 Tax=Rhododendron griersonianum TaxID=479676 RepID=A0AAV6LNU0_9ERIC|nr:hypothetical protein RHGRI_001823 [Rhododendron griersonianum]
MKDGLLSPPSTSATCGSGEKPTDATIHACRPTKYTRSEDTDDVALVDMNCEDFEEATPSRLDIEATSKEMVLMKH